MNSKNIKKNHALEQLTQHWQYVAPFLIYPKDDSDYDLLAQRLDQVLDIVGEDENHPLMALVDFLSYLISAYDEKRFKMNDIKGIDALNYLMQSRQLRQSDLSMIGSQGVVSEILNGNRKLNLRQIKKLSEYFKVTPETFID